VLVATTETVAGAGYGVVYKPLVLIVPALKALPGGPNNDQVTALLKFPEPETVAVNCTWVPMIATLGETLIEVIVGPVYVAVTAVLAFIVTLQVTVVAEVQPDHETKVWTPDVARAVNVTDAPALYVRVKLAVPLPDPLLSAGLTAMAIPLAGLTVFTVRT